MDIAYLDESYFNNKSKYKYIIDSIDHYSKYYWVFLISSKNDEVVLYKIKSFICINKKPKIIQTDNVFEFKNHLLSEFLGNVRIHHPQTNGSLERYHKVDKRFIKENLDNKKDIDDEDLEKALTQYSPNEIRDLDDPNKIDIIL